VADKLVARCKNSSTLVSGITSYGCRSKKSIFSKVKFPETFYHNFTPLAYKKQFDGSHRRQVAARIIPDEKPTHALIFDAGIFQNKTRYVSSGKNAAP